MIQSVDKPPFTQNIEYLIALLFIVLIIWVLLTLSKRLNEEIKSYGVTDERDGEFIVEAHKFTLDCDGRLLFWQHGWLFQRVIAVVDSGKWQRVQEGITLKDLEE